MRPDRSLLPSVLLGIGVFLLFEATSLDLWVQDHAYDFTRHRWLVDAKEPVLRWWFYTGPKAALYLFGAALLAVCSVPRIYQKLFAGSSVRRVDLWIVFATLATAPLLIATAKATTNVFCPSQIRRYGGDVPYVATCGSYPENDTPEKRGRGFPAGHASGGFALVSLAGIGRSRRARWAGLAVGLGLGSAMGIYQILKGAHYLSHTLVTAIVCWIVFLGWRRILAA